MNRPYRRRMSNNYNDLPVGILTIQKLSRYFCPRLHCRKEILLKISVLVLTFAAYTCYHMTRKPISVVKSVLHYNCTNGTSDHEPDCGYAPFDRPDGQSLFGMLDSAFLFSYAIAMFISGFVAERVSLRYFLAFGMIISGIFTYLFGIAKTSNIHSLWYFMIVQACAGVFQTTGWPGVVTVVGRWFGRSKRGLIFGIWNSHTSIGNILGTLIAAYYVESDWALSFAVPGIIMGIVGFVLFLFLVDSPDIVGCQPQRRLSAAQHRISNHSDYESDADNNDGNVDVEATHYEPEVSHRPSERTPILARHHRAEATTNPPHARRAISISDAFRIPGVIEFSLCLFFSKLVSYTFLYWLPLYIQSSSTLGPSSSADLSILFDVGGIFGAITAGMISDYTGMSASVCAVMLFLAAPVLLMYQEYGPISLTISIILLFVAGLLVNGPYALITTSVSAELGQHSSLEGNAKALATVTSIIDGTGSIGAAVGPLFAGFIASSDKGWQDVFYMLIVADVLAMLLLVRLVAKECLSLRRTARIRIE